MKNWYINHFLKKHHFPPIQSINIKENINFSQLFYQLDLSVPFRTTRVDKYIENSLEDIYKENYLFQISYLLLSDYIFNSKEIFIKTIEDVYTNLLTSNYQNIDIILGKLPKINTNTNNLDPIISKINNFLSDPNIINHYNLLLNNDKELNNLNHSNYLCAQKFLYQVILMLLVNQGNIDINDFNKHIQDDIIKYSINQIKKQNNITSKEEFLNYMNNYYLNGYFFHGTNTNCLDNISHYGLNGNPSFTYAKQINKINKIFEHYHVYKVFEGKAEENDCLNYYVTDSLESAIYYANQSPEYLSRFCSNGYHFNSQDYDTNAFFRRDFQACSNNLNKYCKTLSISKKDKSSIIKAFNQIWKNEVKENQRPIIFIGNINIFNERTNEKYHQCKKNISNMKDIDIYKLFTTPENVHNKRLTKILSSELKIINLPNVYQLFKVKPNFNSPQYIYHNSKKIYPDIMIDKVYFILKNIQAPNKITDNIYEIPEDITLWNTKIKNDYFIQELQYLLCGNTICLNEKSQRLINKLKENITIKNILNYYTNLIHQYLIQYKKCNEEPRKSQIFYLLNDNLFYNFYIIRKTNKLPLNVNKGYQVNLKYDYDISNYGYRSKEEQKVNFRITDKIINKMEEILYL